MNNLTDPDFVKLLRNRAVNQLKEYGFTSDRYNIAPLDELLEELQIHRVELEMQRDDMESTYAEMTETLSKQTLRMEEAPLPYMIIDLFGIIQYANAATMELFEKPKKRILQRRLPGMMHPEHADKVHTTLRRLKPPYENLSFAAEYKTDAGKYYPAKFSFGMLKETLNGSPLFSCIITDLKDLVIQLPFDKGSSALIEEPSVNGHDGEDDTVKRVHQLESLLAQREEELDNYSFLATHDLQEPLRMISAFGHLLEQKHKNSIDGETGEYLSYAVDGAERIQNLIYALIDYAHLQKQDEKIELVDMNRAFNTCLQYLSAKIEETNAVIHAEVLPTVFGNSSQLLIVWQHLLMNALKFMENGKMPEIRIEAKEDKEYWTFMIRDNGIGISGKDTDRIFKLFHRLHPKGSYPGTGIGLAVCKKILQLHGGEIWAESKERKGSTFCFKLPKKPLHL